MSKPAGVGGNEMEMDFLKMPAHLNGQMAIMMDSVFEVLESIIIISLMTCFPMVIALRNDKQKSQVEGWEAE
jgi:hypothetical protein